MTNRKHVAILLTAAALAVSGSGFSSAQGRGPVKIGVLTDTSSLYADLSGRGAIEAVKMAAEDAGPVLGGPVEVISGDHQNKPDVAASIARTWYDTEGVDLITDLVTSSTALAVNEISL